ncbi:MAG: glycosyl transferase [Cyclobacteriaceae bacterium]
MNFCTLFNVNYLAKGLTLYRSLENLGINFHLFVYAFDDEVYNFLKKNPEKHLTVVSLREFESEELLEIKRQRTATEYCWTCTPSTIYHAITTFDLPDCTYLDADLYFFSDPKVLVDEMDDKSVLITSHRYTPEYDQNLVSGKYCVQFMTFKNTSGGMEVLKWWREACLDWCYATPEDGKFGDQKYLDDWPFRWPDVVHELKHLGGGLAPWNIQQYAFEQEEHTLVGKEIKTNKHFEVIFYHFHKFEIFRNDAFWLGKYKLNKNVIQTIYAPYLKHLLAIAEEVRNISPNLNILGINGTSSKPSKGFISCLIVYWSHLKMAARYILGFEFKQSYQGYNYYKKKQLVK